MIEYKKDGAVKLIDKESSLHAVLLANGWTANAGIQHVEALEVEAPKKRGRLRLNVETTEGEAFNGEDSTSAY